MLTPSFQTRHLVWHSQKKSLHYKFSISPFLLWINCLHIGDWPINYFPFFRCVDTWLMWRNQSDPCDFGAFLCSRPRELKMPYVTWAAGLIREPFCYSVIDQPPVELLGALSWLLTFSQASAKMSSQLGVAGESKSAVIYLNSKQSCYDKLSASKSFCPPPPFYHFLRPSGLVRDRCLSHSRG